MSEKKSAQKKSGDLHNDSKFVSRKKISPEKSMKNKLEVPQTEKKSNLKNKAGK